MNVDVLRLGHRYVRDDRVTMHVFLTARAFGAGKVIYSGQKDEKMEEGVKKVVDMWGGLFKVEYVSDWKQTIKKWEEKGGEVVHLTIYGLPVQNVIHEIRDSKKDKIIVVGGAKVPRLVYELADWNVAVTSQPHSEISALSVFLHEIFQGEELYKTFKDAKLLVISQSKGKKIERIKS